MKAKILSVLIAMMAVFSTVAFADTPFTLGSELGINIETEDFAPLVFLENDGCDVYHNNADGSELVLAQRIENYAFEGERIVCDVLVIDKNGVPEKLRDVYMTVSVDQEPTPDDIEVNCEYQGCDHPMDEFNARILEESITECNSEYMGVYTCDFRVEKQEWMHGEYWVSVVAEDLDGLLGWADEQQFWFLNPEIAIEVMGSVDFGVVRPGTISYADTITVQNAAEDGSGVLLNMLISGSDFYDSANSGAKCPTSNVLELDNFAYYATNGAYRTQPTSGRVNALFGVNEGYFGIPYETGEESKRLPIIQDTYNFYTTPEADNLWAGNILSPGAEISMTFALALPEPCNGDFSEGSIFLWAEAV
jgi:hypothetical protein